MTIFLSNTMRKCILIAVVFVLVPALPCPAQDSEKQQEDVPDVEEIVNRMQENIGDLGSFSGTWRLEYKSRSGAMNMGPALGEVHYEGTSGEWLRFDLSKNAANEGTFFSTTEIGRENSIERLQVFASQGGRSIGFQAAARTTHESGSRDRPMLGGMYSQFSNFIGSSGTTITSLIAYHVVPSLLLQVEPEVRKEEGDDQTWLVISIPSSGHWKQAVEKIFVDPDTYRIEKVTGKVSGYNKSAKSRVQCTSYRKVGEDVFPERVKFSVANGRMSYVATIEEILTGKDAEPVQRTGLRTDPALPELAGGNLEKLKQKIKNGNAEAPDYQMYMNEYMSNMMMFQKVIQGNTGNIEDVLGPMKEAEKKHRNSRVLPDLVSILQHMVGKTDQVSRRATELRKKKRNAPLTFFMAFDQHLKNDRTKKAETVRNALPEGSPYGRIARAMSFRHTIKKTEKPELFVKKLNQKQAEVSTSQFRVFLEYIEPRIVSSRSSRRRQRIGVLTSRDGSFIKKLLEHGEGYGVQLIAARGWFRKQEYDRAADLFEKIQEQQDASDEIGHFVAAVREKDREKAVQLVKRFSDHVHQVLPLFTAAVEAWKKEGEEQKKKGFNYLHRGIKALEKNGLQDNIYSLKRNKDVLKTFQAIAEKLQSSEQTEWIRRYLFALRDAGPRIFSTDEFEKTIEMAGGFLSDADPDTRYQFVKGFEDVSDAENFADPDFLIKHIKAKGDETTLSDYHFLAQMLREERSIFGKEKQRKACIDIFTRGQKAHPEDVLMNLRLGDLRFKQDDVEGAFTCFERSLKQVQKGEDLPGSSNIQRRMQVAQMHRRGGDAKEKGLRFLVILPLPVKYAMAAKQIEKQETARGNIDALVSARPEAQILSGSAKAMKILGDDDRALQYLLRAFQKEKSSGSPFQTYRGGSVAKQLVEAFKKQDQYFRAILILEACIDRGYRNADKLKKKIKELRQKVDMSKVREEYLNADFPSISDEKMESVRETISKLKARSFKKRKQAMKTLREMGPKITPVLREYLDAENAEINKRVHSLIDEYARKHIRKEVLSPDAEKEEDSAEDK